jgi:hypothetical protein
MNISLVLLVRLHERDRSDLASMLLSLLSDPHIDSAEHRVLQIVALDRGSKVRSNWTVHIAEEMRDLAHRCWTAEHARLLSAIVALLDWPFPGVREEAVHDLDRWLHTDPQRYRSTVEVVLRRVESEDQSPRVSEAARAVLRRHVPGTTEQPWTVAGREADAGFETLSDEPMA